MGGIEVQAEGWILEGEAGTQGLVLGQGQGLGLGLGPGGWVLKLGPQAWAGVFVPRPISFPSVAVRRPGQRRPLV